MELGPGRRPNSERAPKSGEDSCGVFLGLEDSHQRISTQEKVLAVRSTGLCQCRWIELNHPRVMARQLQGQKRRLVFVPSIEILLGASDESVRGMCCRKLKIGR